MACPVIHHSNTSSINVPVPTARVEDPERCQGPAHGASVPVRLIPLDEADSGLIQICTQAGATDEPLI